jgi:hypothetical protein
MKLTKDGRSAVVRDAIQLAAYKKAGWTPVEVEAKPNRDDLKARAVELGIDFPANITTAKLAEMVAVAEAGAS